MRNIHGVSKEIEFVKTLKMITEVYQDISVTRMQRIRKSVVKTREYLSKFSGVYHDVKSSYKQEILKLMKKKDVKDFSKFSMMKKNGKTISILISANTKLHGDIIQKVNRLFLESIQKDNSDIVIIGKLGRSFFEQSGLKKQYMYFEIPDIDLKLEDLKPIIYNIVNYEVINVYYGKFENIVTQNPIVSNVTGHTPLENESNNTPLSLTLKMPDKFVFEPSLEHILQFFETQIFSSLFKQAVHESQLARYASRLKGMEEALQNIAAKTQTLYTEKRKIKQLANNKKQLEMMSGISLWRR